MAEVYGKSPDYHTINNGLHRTIPVELHAPALTWQVGFWITGSGCLLDSCKDCPERVANCSLASYVYTLTKGGNPPEDSYEYYSGKKRACKLQVDHSIINLVNNLINFSSNGKVTDIKFGIDEISAVEKIHLFDRIFIGEGFTEGVGCKKFVQTKDPSGRSAGSVVKLSFKMCGIVFRVVYRMSVEYFTISTYAEIKRDTSECGDGSFGNVNKIFSKLTGFISSHGDDAFDESFSEYLFHGFWDKYYSEIVSSGVGGDDQSLSKLYAHSIFADFRGIVIDKQSVEDKSRHDSDISPSVTSAGAGVGKSHPVWGDGLIGKIRPVIARKALGDGVVSEYCANYIMDGRAIYASSLAPHVVEKPSKTRIPVDFIVCVGPGEDGADGLDSWQLGRAIFYLHRCGILRLVALKDAEDLHEAASGLSYFDMIVIKARALINNPDLSSKTVLAAIEAARNSFNRVSVKFAQKNKYTFSFRVAQSVSSINKLRSIMDSLRIVRLKNAVPYDIFIERRLGAEFDFISRLGARYEKASSTMADLNETHISIQTKDLSHRVCRMQELAEIALFCVIVPYYLSYLLDEANVTKYFEKLVHLDSSGVITLVWFGLISFYLLIYRNKSD